jgi:hypothetical protein
MTAKSLCLALALALLLGTGLFGSSAGASPPDSLLYECIVSKSVDLAEHKAGLSYFRTLCDSAAEEGGYKNGFVRPACGPTVLACPVMCLANVESPFVCCGVPGTDLVGDCN